MKKIYIYDSTLRDGAQGKNISFTVSDKLKIVKKLDELGVDYIEAGNPGSNPKDNEFFAKVNELKLNHSKLVSFGSTRRPNIKPEEDKNLQSLLSANTKTVAIFGKSWAHQVTNILKTSKEENLLMIADTIKYLKSFKKEVIFDAEHFFDGYFDDEEYAMETIIVASKSGADRVCLCDTKGGSFPDDISNITKKVIAEINCPVGIHCHNDNGMAVACSIVSVLAGAKSVQGTFNGIGERCGNANLATIIGNLQFLKGYDCIDQKNEEYLTETAHYISEVSNIKLTGNSPFVGNSAFSHKAGMHADAVKKDPQSYELFNPERIGNVRKILMSEVSGRSSILEIINRVDPTIEKNSKETAQVIKKLKEMEHLGYQYEAAEASLELMIQKTLGKYIPAFELVEFKAMINEPSINEVSSSVILKIKVDDKYEITAAEGNGPVDALDYALRKALKRFYSCISNIKLTDYKVRVLDSENATGANVRVLIESTDGNETWNTIGVSTDIIEASWKALVDSIEYYICNRG